MTDQSEVASSSTPSTLQNVASTSTAIRGGFYSKFSAGRNFETPTKPSFLEDSSKTLDGVLASASKKHDFPPSATLYSVPSSDSVMSTSIFGSAKRKRTVEVVSKPSFKVSDFIGASPHLPKFGTSLTKVKFDLSSFNQSKFYSGRTKFGGSSSFREESASAKRIKISPVSYRGPTNLTRVSAKPYSSENKRAITSKTAENILNTLNKICTPVKPPEKQPFHSEFSSFSKRLREKRKAGMSSLPPPPIAKLNRVKSAHVTNTKIDEAISTATTEIKCSDNGTVISPESISTKPSEQPATLPSEIETDVSISEPIKIPESVTVNATEVEIEKPPEIQLVDNSDTMTVHVQTPFERLPVKPIENDIPKINDDIPKVVDVQAAVVSKNGLKMKRQRTKDHYTASEKVEVPVNTMPEITAVKPLVVSTLPKFELSVKPAATPIFTPMSKLPKPVDTLKDIPSNNDQKFGFSSPKVISDKGIECISSDTNFSFISPVSIKNPGTPIVSKTKSKLIVGGLYPKEILGTKPSAKETPSVAITGNKEAPLTFGFKIPKKEEGSWECPTCMITNKADCMKCIACTEPKPGSESLTTKTEPLFSFGQSTSTISGFSFGKTTVSSSTFSFASTNTVSSTGFTFSKPFSTICSSELTLGKTSDVTSNISSELKIESTDEGNRSSPFSMPIPASLKSDTFGTDRPLPEIGTSVISKVSIEDVKPNPLLKFKPLEGSWECPTCMISNKSDVLKCVSCTEPKPGSTDTESACGLTAADGKPEFKCGSADSKTEFIFGSADSKTEFKFGSADSQTEFKFGGGTNGKTELKFGDTSSKVEFKFVAPANSTSSNFSFGVTSSSTNATASSNPSSISFTKPLDSNDVENPFLKFKPIEGSWECPTCMISNKPDVLKCAACSEPKPGAPPAIETEVDKPSLFGSSNSRSFTFGTSSQTSSSGGFSFQNIAAESQDVSKPASSIAISQPTGSMFSFGKPSVEPGGSSGFSFVAASSVVSSASIGFSFAPSAPSLSTASTGELASSSQFSFINASNSGTGFSFGNPSNTFGSANSVGFTFGSGIQKDTKDAEVNSMTNVFGNQADKKLMNGPSSSEQPPPTGFSFGVASNVEKSVNSSSGNIFSSISSFGSSKVNGIPAATEISTPQFNFSSNAKPSFLVNSDDAKQTESLMKFNFNPGSMTTPNFNFGASSSAATIFGNPNSNGQFNFAGNDPANNETSKANIFASPSTSSNLFSIGGGGSNDTNSTAERRKVKRAHRRLPRK